MCVIACYESNFPESTDLISMESMNPHGGGIAWIDNNKVYWKKGLTAKDIIIMIKKGQVKLPMIIHFRIASIGKINNKLTHPFRCDISDKNKLEGSTIKPILFHNGTWGDYLDHLRESIHGTNHKIPDGDLSDSRVMAYLVARHGVNYMNLIDEDSKVTIMTPQGIIKFGDWFKEGKKGKEFEVSNTYYKQTWKTGYREFEGMDEIDKLQTKLYSKKKELNELEGFERYVPKCSRSDNWEDDSGMDEDTEYPFSVTKKELKRLKRLLYRGFGNLTKKEQDILCDKFDTDVLSYDQYSIYEEMEEMGFDKKDIATHFFSNDCNMKDTRLSILGY